MFIWNSKILHLNLQNIIKEIFFCLHGWHYSVSLCYLASNEQNNHGSAKLKLWPCDIPDRVSVTWDLLPKFLLDSLFHGKLLWRRRVEGLLQNQTTESSCGAEETFRFYGLFLIFMLCLAFFPLCQLLPSVSLDFTASLMASFWGAMWQFCSRLHILCVTHIPELQRYNFTKSQNMLKPLI